PLGRPSELTQQSIPESSTASPQATQHAVPFVPSNTSSSGRDRKPIQACVEPVLLQDCGDPFVVDGSVRIDPVALGVDRQCQNLGQVGPFQQNLASRHQGSQQVEFHIVHLEQL